MEIVKHEPVLVSEVIGGLGLIQAAHLNSQAKFIDATLGEGGHSLEILKLGIKVLGIEQDPETLEIARARLKKYNDGFFPVLGNFREIKRIAEEKGFLQVQGILFDLGVNTMQLTSAERGFSFAHPEARLDMRLDPRSQGVNAADLLNALRTDQLEKLFVQVLPRSESARLAQKVVDARKMKKFENVGDFLGLVNKVGDKPKLNPATLPLMALRIAVNDELDSLARSLPQALDLLVPKGRLAVISFHSGEDRIVKRFFKQCVKDQKGVIINKKPIVPTPKEKEANPRSRSARLRVLEKKYIQS